MATFAAQLIFTPVIMHLYDPAAYGTMGSVMGLALLCLPYSTLQYDRAMLLVRDENELQGLRTLSNYLPIAFALVLFTVLLIGGNGLLTAVGLPALGLLALVAPLLIVVSAWAQTSQQMVFARVRYKQNFVFGSLNAFGNKLVAIGYALVWGSGAVGLLLAEFLSRSAQLFFNNRLILRDPPQWARPVPSRTEVWRVARKYSGFPKYELPAVALAGIANQAPLWWIPKHFGLAAFGQFSLAMALLEIPLRLFGNSISSAFYQKAAQTFADKGPKALAQLTNRMVLILAVVGIIPFVTIALSAEPVFVFLFKDRWALAGTITASFCLFYYCRLVAEPVASVFRVVGAQWAYLSIHGLFLIIRVGIIAWTLMTDLPFIDAIRLYVWGNAFVSCVLIALVLILTRRATDTIMPHAGPA
ncbi:MAG: hypothetical protein KBF80_07655 [Flavobacteriales bacterium]|nr:hypothetical protein [Flavobacteriales bacterium]